MLTKPDLQNNDSRANLRATMEELIRMNCVPIINANDAVVPPLGPEVDLAGVIFIIVAFLIGSEDL